MEKIVFVDLETGGLNPKKHAITQIAAIAVGDGLEELEVFERKVQFGTLEGTKEALNKQKYDPETWAREGRRADEAAREFASFLRRHAAVEKVAKNGRPYRLALIAGHNAASFDVPFLQEWYRRQKSFCPAAHTVLCTLQRAQWYFFAEHPEVTPPANFQLGTLCEYFGLDFPEDVRHDALADIRATLDLYRVLRAPVRIAA